MPEMKLENIHSKIFGMDFHVPGLYFNFQVFNYLVINSTGLGVPDNLHENTRNFVQIKEAYELSVHQDLT